jgi:hypothetical protein
MTARGATPWRASSPDAARAPWPARRRQVRRLWFMVAALLSLLVVQLGATFGLVFAVVAVTKDSRVDADTSALLDRSGSYLGTTPVFLSVTSSDVPDAVFADVRTIYVALPAGGAAQLQVTGFLRLPVSALGANADGLTYGPLVLLTPQGNMLLAGEAVTPLDAVLPDLVADASAAVTNLFAAQAAGRHLLEGWTLGTGSVMTGATTGSLPGGLRTARPMAVSEPRG